MPYSYITDNSVFQNKAFIDAMITKAKEKSENFSKAGKLTRREEKILCEKYGIEYGDFKEFERYAEDAFAEDTSEKYKYSRFSNKNASYDDWKILGENYEKLKAARQKMPNNPKLGLEMTKQLGALATMEDIYGIGFKPSVMVLDENSKYVKEALTQKPELTPRQSEVDNFVSIFTGGVDLSTLNDERYVQYDSSKKFSDSEYNGEARYLDLSQALGLVDENPLKGNPERVELIEFIENLNGPNVDEKQEIMNSIYNCEFNNSSKLLNRVLSGLVDDGRINIEEKNEILTRAGGLGSFDYRKPVNQENALEQYSELYKGRISTEDLETFRLLMIE